jgi:hypothetical protein
MTVIKKEDRESPVKQAELVHPELIHGTYRPVMAINQYDVV